MPAFPDMSPTQPAHVLIRPLRYLAVLAAVLTLAACTHMALQYKGDALGELNRAMQNNDYNKAWYIVDHIPASHPQYAAVKARRKSVEQQAHAWETKQIAQSEQLADKDHWDQAVNTLQGALSHWNDSKALQRQYQRLRQQRDDYTNRLRADALLTQARALLKSRGDIKRLAGSEDPRARSQARAMHDQSEKLAKDLHDLSTYFAGRGDWARTQDCLTTSDALNRKSTPDPLLVKARQHLARAERRQRLLRQQRLGRQADELLTTYQHSNKLSDLLAARDYIQQHNEDGLLEEQARELRLQVGKRLQAGLRQGESLYARGDYAHAYRAWKAVEPLDPENSDLRKKLERAHRVLKNLKKLSSPGQATHSSKP